MQEDSIGILLIADDVGLRRALKDKLEACGFTVCETCEAVEGLQTIADGFQPHVVITDMLADDATQFTAAMRMLWEGPVNVVALDDMAQLVGNEEDLTSPHDHSQVENAILGLARAG